MMMNGSSKVPKRVLIAPLDWGLGHATRCIPVIRLLVQRGAAVYLAGEGPVQALLQSEFPQLPFLPLPGYRVLYGASAAQTTARVLQQLPKIGAAIQTENRWLAAMMEQHGFDVVIADNRYGLHHPGANCILMTHQLCIQTPLQATTRLLQTIHYRYISPFDSCWVPDMPEAPSLAGALSHPKQLPEVPVRYVGPLSRFAGPGLHNPAGPLLLLVSGPEPQRTLFEKILLLQAAFFRGPVVLVRGLPGQQQLPQVPPNVQVFNHLPSGQLEQLLQQASLVVCRSGYSTVMDLAALGKKSILVPTPGQTEQQYLARHLQQQGFALWRHQQDFDLQEALQAAAGFSYRVAAPAAQPLLEQALNTLCGNTAV